MSSPVETSAYVKLQRLWKGTMLVGVGGGYVLLVAMLFVYHGWRPALLALFLVALSQFFRYIAGDVDRIGWRMSNEQSQETLRESTNEPTKESTNESTKESTNESTVRYQWRMLIVLAGLAQSINLALVYQSFHLGGLRWMLATLAGLALIEVLYSRIRRVNRRVEFEQASYGFKDRGPLSGGPENIRPSDRARRDKLDRKLDELKTLVDEGRITQKAYERACDKHRVRAVMDVQ